MLTPCLPAEALPPALAEQLERLAALSAAMQAAAARGDWADVHAADAARYAILQTLPPAQLARTPAARTVLESALSATACVIAQASHCRADDLAQVKALQRGQRATAAYLKQQP